MIDRSVVYPREMMEDVLVKIDELIMFIDFIILDMEDSPNGEED